MERIRSRTNAHDSGSALVPVLVLLAGILLMSFAFSHSTLSEHKSLESSLDDRRAFYLAEAGLHEAYEALRDGRSGNVGDIGAPAYLDGGLLWVTAEDIGNDQRRLVATALSGRGRQALEAVVHLAPDKPPLFVATLNSKETLTLNEGVIIDSYDSEVGTYASQVASAKDGISYANANGDVRSNQDIILNAHAYDFGDAIPGPGQNVSLSTGAYIDGAIVPATEEFIFPDIEYPVFTPQGNYTVPTAGTKTLGPGNYDFDTFSIGKDATLTVTGPATIVVDDFAGGKTANLKIDASGGPVTFYVRNSYTHTSGFTADAVTGSPMLLAFLVGGTQDIVFPSATKVRGAYYAPNADILFANGNECWGAFAANRISMSNDMRFHYDETLLRAWSGESGNDGDRLSVLAWHRTAVLPQNLVTSRRDPLVLLGVRAEQLLSPGDSWRE